MPIGARADVRICLARVDVQGRQVAIACVYGARICRRLPGVHRGRVRARMRVDQSAFWGCARAKLRTLGT